jgi:hypothetical protein
MISSGNWSGVWVAPVEIAFQTTPGPQVDKQPSARAEPVC